jgi:hypothetical protein
MQKLPPLHQEENASLKTLSINSLQNFCTCLGLAILLLMFSASGLSLALAQLLWEDRVFLGDYFVTTWTWTWTTFKSFGRSDFTSSELTDGTLGLTQREYSFS